MSKRNFFTPTATGQVEATDLRAHWMTGLLIAVLLYMQTLYLHISVIALCYTVHVFIHIRNGLCVKLNCGGVPQRTIHIGVPAPCYLSIGTLITTCSYHGDTDLMPHVNPVKQSVTA